MIQRIQSVYLFLSLITTALLFYLPGWFSGESAAIPYYPYSTGYISAYSHPLLLGVWLISLLLQLVAIFLFKKRKVQLRIVLAAIFANLVFFTAALFLANQHKGINDSVHNFKIGIILPLISIILLILANRAIRKDEELIRSMNRLR